MSFRFGQSETIDDAVRRVATEQLDKAIAASAQTGSAAGEAVHDIRRCCKRVRALIRLVRSSLPRFKKYDNWLRDTAAILSDVRDAAVVPATHAVVAATSDSVADDSAAATLAAARRFPDGCSGSGEPELEEKLARVRERLIQIRADVEGWKVKRDDFDAVRDGLRVTYTRSRKAMKRAIRSAKPRDCHEWRKRVKYHAFQMQLLHEAWPDVMQAREAAADELGDLLGQIHDLDVYRDAIGSGSQSREPRLAAKRLAAGLLERCWPLGQRLFAPAPAVFMREIETWWNASRAG